MRDSTASASATAKLRPFGGPAIRLRMSLCQTRRGEHRHNTAVCQRAAQETVFVPLPSER